MQVDNSQAGIEILVPWLKELQPELIAVEATGGYQRASDRSFVLGRFAGVHYPDALRGRFVRRLYFIVHVYP